MPDDKKTQETSVKEEVQEENKETLEQEDKSSEYEKTFKELAEKEIMGEKTEAKRRGRPPGSKKKAEEETASEEEPPKKEEVKEEKKEEKVEEKPKEEEYRELSAKEIFDQQQKDFLEELEKKGKAIGDDGKIIDIKKAKKEEEKSKEEEKREIKEITDEVIDEVVKNLKLSDAEKSLLEDEPTIASIAGKIAASIVNKTRGGVVEVKLAEGEKKSFNEMIEKQKEEIDKQAAQIIVMKEVPDWESIVYDGRKIDKKGDRVFNQEFWSWVDKQSPVVNRMLESNNIWDNVAVFKLWKDVKATEQLTKEKEKQKETLEKKKAISNAPQSGKIPPTRGKKDLSFEESWQEAAEKLKEGEL